MVVDNLKEQTRSKFAKKCRKADYHLVTTKPYSPWMQTAEGSIEHTKFGSLRKMLKTGSPKPLWDHCIELKAQIRSHTALNIYGLEGEVLETLMTGKNVV